MQCIKPTSIVEFVFGDNNSTVTVARAANLLSYALDSGQDRVKLAGKKIQIYELGSHPELQDLPADKIKITFIGGPPGAYKVYSGTLLTLLVDRFIWDEIHGNVTIFNTIQKFLGRKFPLCFWDWMRFDEPLTHGTSKVSCKTV